MRSSKAQPGEVATEKSYSPHGPLDRLIDSNFNPAGCFPIFRFYYVRLLLHMHSFAKLRPGCASRQYTAHVLPRASRTYHPWSPPNFVGGSCGCVLSTHACCHGLVHKTKTKAHCMVWPGSLSSALVAQLRVACARRY